MLKLCGETQDKLAHELLLFELTIEGDVVEPLYDLAEVRKQTNPSRSYFPLFSQQLFVTQWLIKSGEFIIQKIESTLSFPPLTPALVPAGGNPKYPETEEALSQAGPGHGLSAHTVSPIYTSNYFIRIFLTHIDFTISFCEKPKYVIFMFWEHQQILTVNCDTQWLLWVHYSLIIMKSVLFF